MTTTTSHPYPHPTLTPIMEKPTVGTLQRLKREVFANARSVHTTFNGGTHGYLGVVMSDADYNTRAGANFTAPVHPGALPVHAPGATSAQITAANRTYDTALALFEQYNKVVEELRSHNRSQ